MKVFRINLKPVFMLYITSRDFGIIILSCFGFEMITGVKGKLFVITFLFKEFIIHDKKERQHYEKLNNSNK
jgi:hypothetical protein